MDLHWPGILSIEMKAPQVALDKAKDQRQRYWQESSDSAKDIPADRQAGFGGSAGGDRE